MLDQKTAAFLVELVATPIPERSSSLDTMSEGLSGKKVEHRVIKVKKEKGRTWWMGPGVSVIVRQTLATMKKYNMKPPFDGAQAPKISPKLSTTWLDKQARRMQLDSLPSVKLELSVEDVILAQLLARLEAAGGISNDDVDRLRPIITKELSQALDEKA